MTECKYIGDGKERSTPLTLQERAFLTHSHWASYQIKSGNNKDCIYRKSKRRLPEWDFVKAVLIIFVVWGHICSYISDSSYDKNALTALIRLYQMPMFILISGFFQRPCRTFSEIKEKGIKIFKATPHNSDGVVAPSDFSSNDTNRRRLY